MIKKIIFPIVICATLHYLSAADKDEADKRFAKTIALAKKRRNSDASIPSLSFDRSRPLSPGRGLKDRQARSLPSSPNSDDYRTVSPKTTNPDLVFFQHELLRLNKSLGITSKTAFKLSLAVENYRKLSNKKFELTKKRNETLSLFDSQAAALETQIDQIKTAAYGLISKGNDIFNKHLSKKLEELTATTSQPDSK